MTLPGEVLASLHQSQLMVLSESLILGTVLLPRFCALHAEPLWQNLAACCIKCVGSVASASADGCVTEYDFSCLFSSALPAVML